MEKGAHERLPKFRIKGRLGDVEKSNIFEKMVLVPSEDGRLATRQFGAGSPSLRFVSLAFPYFSIMEGANASSLSMASISSL